MRGPSPRLFVLAVVAVTAAALAAAVCTYHQVAHRAAGELVQASVSPGGRWQAEALFVDDDGLGPHPGVLRLDVVDLTSPSRWTRSIFVAPARDRYAARAIAGWVDADRIALFREFGGKLFIDVSRANTARSPQEFRNAVAAGCAACAALLATAAGGLLAVLLLYTWARRKAWAREAASEEPAWSGARRRAQHG
jgi:hypothetical protein